MNFRKNWTQSLQSFLASNPQMWDQMTLLTSLGSICLQNNDPSEPAAPTTHQHIIHQMPIMTQLWMNLNWVDI
jgi:hypothetical protein